MRLTPFFAAILLLAPSQAQTGLTSPDLYKLRPVGEVQLSPDASHIAYAVTNNDQPGRPYSQTWIMTVDTKQSVQIGRASTPRWSPDGQMIAYFAARRD